MGSRTLSPGSRCPRGHYVKGNPMSRRELEKKLRVDEFTVVFVVHEFRDDRPRERESQPNPGGVGGSRSWLRLCGGGGKEGGGEASQPASMGYLKTMSRPITGKERGEVGNLWQGTGGEGRGCGCGCVDGWTEGGWRLWLVSSMSSETIGRGEGGYNRTKEWGWGWVDTIPVWLRR